MLRQEPEEDNITAADRKKRLNITNVWVDPVDIDEAARRVASLVLSGRTQLSRDVNYGGNGGGDGGGLAPLAKGGMAPEGFMRQGGLVRSSADSGSGGGGGSGGLAGDRDNRCEWQVAQVCTPNAEFMMGAQKDCQFMHILNEAELVIPDGAGVVLAARLLGYGRIARAPGFDLARKLLLNPAEYPFSFYLLGGKPGVAEKAASHINNESPNTRIAGYRNGYFTESDEPAVVDEINDSGADILFVALGAPKAEKWIYDNRRKLRAPVCMGVGGALDIFAGTAQLSPPFFREHGLEWLYRLCREPWRAKRMLKLPQFVLFTIWWKFSHHKKR